MKPSPPRLATWILRQSAPDYDADAMLGDLEEEFRARAVRDGRRSAARWYWRQTRQSAIPNLKRRVQSHIQAPEETHTMNAFTQDIRLAFRALVRRPLFSTIAIVSLTIGIGLSTGVFGVLDAAALRPLSIERPDELRVILERREQGINHNFTYPGFEAFSVAQKSFAGVIAHSPVEAGLNTAAGSEMLNGEIVSANYFATLGPRMAMGRPLTLEDNNPASPFVIVVTAFEWRRQFGDTSELGNRSVKLNGHDFAVVGVTAKPFRGMRLGRDSAFFAPVVRQQILSPSGNRSLLTATGVSWLTVIGRLAPGSTDAQAVAELDVIGKPLTNTPPNVPAKFALAPGGQGDSSLPEAVGPTLELLLGASLLVMLVACANVAGLMLARVGDRQRELAVRAALGGGRWRLARMLMAEALVLGLFGTAAGLVVARAIGPLGVSLLTQFGEPVTLDVETNWRTVALAASAGVLTALLAGLAPVIRGWRSAGLSGLGEGGRSHTTGRAARRWRKGLVIAQFALTFALVATAGLLVRTLANLHAIPTGLDTDHVLLVGLNIGAAQFDPTQARDYVDRALSQTQAVNGVRAVGFAQVLPLGFGGSRTTISAPGYAPAPGVDMEINYNIVSPGYFDSVGIPLSDGRTFREGLTPTTVPIEVVVNETLAHQFWPGQRAVGRQMHRGDGPDAPLMEVVGVVPDVKYREIREEPRPSFYTPVAQATRLRVAVLHVRAIGSPAGIAEAVRVAVGTVDSRVPIAYVRPLDEQRSLNVNRERATMIIGVALGTTALLLSAVGLFGAMASLVAARMREMGVRLALGAVPGALIRLVLRDGFLMAIAGGVLGLVLAWQLGKAVESRLFGVDTFDAISLAAAFALLSTVALLATWLPAMRVGRVDPVEVLRVD